jgi:hypothetical protein
VVAVIAHAQNTPCICQSREVGGHFERGNLKMVLIRHWDPATDVKDDSILGKGGEVVDEESS